MRAGCLFLLLVACGAEPEPTRDSQPREPAVPPDAPLVVFFGDSITAGIHLAERDAFPAIVQRALVEAGRPIRVINAGNSGETSAGGLRRIDWLLNQKPAIVVVELGGNDGLRGQPVANVRANLEAILDRIRDAGARALLLGMRIPTSYGPEYTESFARIYDELAKERGLPYVPFFMEEIAGKPEFFLEDALHPNEEGHAILAKQVTPVLEGMLR